MPKKNIFIESEQVDENNENDNPKIIENLKAMQQHKSFDESDN